MKTEREMETPFEVSELNEYRARLIAEVGARIRSIMGNNFGKRIALGVASEQTEEITMEADRAER